MPSFDEHVHVLPLERPFSVSCRHVQTLSVGRRRSTEQTRRMRINRLECLVLLNRTAESVWQPLLSWSARKGSEAREAYIPLGPGNTFPFIEPSRRGIATGRKLFFNLQVRLIHIFGNRRKHKPDPVAFRTWQADTVLVRRSGHAREDSTPG